MVENEHEFSCPYCGETLSIRIDMTGGDRQTFIYDCEVCCQPIQIQFELKENEVSNFTAEPSD